METPEFKNEIHNQLIISNQTRDNLIVTTKWAKFLSIIGFIGIGLLAFCSLAMISMRSLFMESSGYGSMGGFPGMMGSGFWMLGVFYLIFAAVYFFPTYYLFKFSTDTRNGLNTNDQLLLDSGLKKLMSAFKFWGILTIIMLALTLFAFPVTMMSALSGM